jgi:hypothetical protein
MSNSRFASLSIDMSDFGRYGLEPYNEVFGRKRIT